MDTEGGVTSANSSVDPDNFDVFGLPFKGSTRSGVRTHADASRRAPLSFSRDQTRPTWVLDLALTSGACPVRRAANDSVGEGTWRLDFGTAVSVRPEWWVEPWFRMDTFMRFQDAGSLFQNIADTQTLTSPGHAITARSALPLYPSKMWQGVAL